MNTKETLAVILGGGRGTRLAPLTLTRSKPAINLAGKFRLIDVPVSNCINSQVVKIFVATQFLSTGLHRHIFQTYQFDRFSNGFVQILAAEQTPTNTEWFQGTADAIRQSLHYITEWNIRYVLILSGDQLYSMDYRKILAFHEEKRADVTVSTLPIPQEDVSRMGIMQIDGDGKITRFVEKPKEPEIQQQLASDEGFIRSFGIDPAGRRHLGSMGVYVFSRRALIELLSEQGYVDFGREVIPVALEKYRVFGYVFDGFWEDIGTIESYYRTNLMLTDPNPPFDFYCENWPMFTHSRSLPGVKVVGGTVRRAILCEGCIVDNARVEHSIVGYRQMIRSGSEIRDSLILGADYYETEEPGGMLNGFRQKPHSVPLGIGHSCRIEGAIIDKNTAIGDGVVIRSKQGEPDYDGDGYFIRSGIVIVPRGGVLYPGTVI